MLTIPEGYKTVLDVYDTQQCIEFIKAHFQNNLRAALNLKRVSAPLFVRADTGLNDDLNGIERPVAFDVPATGDGSTRSSTPWPSGSAGLCGNMTSARATACTPT